MKQQIQAEFRSEQRKIVIMGSPSTPPSMPPGVQRIEELRREVEERSEREAKERQERETKTRPEPKARRHREGDPWPTRRRLPRDTPDADVKG